jgi:ATP synthase protein I
MAERKPPHSLEELDARMREARSRQSGAGPARGGEQGEGGGLGMAWRVGLELVSALAIGVAIGYLLDRWLGTKPWLLILFFVLGSAAGMLNVFRMVSGQGGAVGYRKGPETPAAGADDEGKEG